MRYVAFLSGINVGGHRVKMDALRAEFESLGHVEVSTFIASGNVIFTSRKKPTALEAETEARLEQVLGYRVPTFVRKAADLAAVASHEPWGPVPDGQTLMVWFLRDSPDGAARTATEALSNTQDRFSVVGTELYQQIVGGVSDSSVKPAVLARALGRPATSRNARSLRKLVASL